MSEATALRRRWYQFSLGTIFWLILLAGLSALAIREHRETARLEDELADSQRRVQLLQIQTEVLEFRIKSDRSNRSSLEDWTSPPTPNRAQKNRKESPPPEYAPTLEVRDDPWTGL